MSQTFKLIVSVTDNCIEVCRYLSKNISDVNRLGVRVHIEKIAKSEFDETMVDTLRRKGITRLPALIVPDGKVFIGLKSIVDLFEKNLRPMRNNMRIGGGAATPRYDALNDIGTNPDMNEFYMRELYSGRDNTGKLLPRDDDDSDDESKNMKRKLESYRRNAPTHRQNENAIERDIDPQPKQRQRVFVDNVASEEEDGYEERPRELAPIVSKSDDAMGDELDQRMMAAWMNNNASD